MSERDREISAIERQIQLQQILIKVSQNPSEFVSILQDPHHLARLQEFLECSQEMAEQVLHRMTVDVFTGPRRRKAEHDLAYLEQRRGFTVLAGISPTQKVFPRPGSEHSMNSPSAVPAGSPGPFPRMVLSSPLTGYDVTLAEGKNAVVALRALQALPGVLSFTLQIFSAPGLEVKGRGAQKVPRPGPGPGGFVVEALFKDAQSPGDEPVRVPVDVHSGGGGMGRWDLAYWFKVPDPVPAEVALAVSWPDAGIQPTVLSIARDDILEATPEELSFPGCKTSPGK